MCPALAGTQTRMLLLNSWVLMMIMVLDKTKQNKTKQHAKEIWALGLWKLIGNVLWCLRRERKTLDIGNKWRCQCNLSLFKFLEDLLVLCFPGVFGRENFLYTLGFLISSFGRCMQFGFRVGGFIAFWLFCLFLTGLAGVAVSKSVFKTLCKQFHLFCQVVWEK